MPLFVYSVFSPNNFRNNWRRDTLPLLLFQKFTTLNGQFFQMMGSDTRAVGRFLILLGVYPSRFWPMGVFSPFSVLRLENAKVKRYISPTVHNWTMWIGNIPVKLALCPSYRNVFELMGFSAQIKRTPLRRGRGGPGRSLYLSRKTHQLKYVSIGWAQG